MNFTKLVILVHCYFSTGFSVHTYACLLSPEKSSVFVSANIRTEIAFYSKSPSSWRCSLLWVTSGNKM